jgi:hypothetical protein
MSGSVGAPEIVPDATNRGKEPTGGLGADRLGAESGLCLKKGG